MVSLNADRHRIRYTEKLLPPSLRVDSASRAAVADGHLYAEALAPRAGQADSAPSLQHRLASLPVRQMPYHSLPQQFSQLQLVTRAVST